MQYLIVFAIGYFIGRKDEVRSCVEAFKKGWHYEEKKGRGK